MYQQPLWVSCFGVKLLSLRSRARLPAHENIILILFFLKIIVFLPQIEICSYFTIKWAYISNKIYCFEAPNLVGELARREAVKLYSLRLRVRLSAGATLIVNLYFVTFEYYFLFVFFIRKWFEDIVFLPQIEIIVTISDWI